MNEPDPAEILDLGVLDELRQLSGDDDPDLISELVSAYLEDAPARMCELQVAHEQGDREGIGRVAHALKSSSAYLGATNLSAMFRDLEAIASERTDSDPGESIQGCLAEFERVTAALRAVVE